MGFKEQIAKDADVFLNESELAEVVVYNGVSITAVFERGQTLAPGNTFVSDGESDRAELHVAAELIPDPKPLDEIEAGGVTWQVARILESDGVIHRLELIANERPGW